MLFRKVIPALHCVPYFVPHLTACYSANGFRSIWSCPVDCPMGSRIGSCMDCYAMPWRPSSAMLGKDEIFKDGILIDGNQTITTWTTCLHNFLPLLCSFVPLFLTVTDNTVSQPFLKVKGIYRKRRNAIAFSSMDRRSGISLFSSGVMHSRYALIATDRILF